jgi:nucleoside-diphosphate-sugar epimerase
MSADAVLRAAAPFRGRAVLVTGAGGFVGANLVRALVAAGCMTHAVARRADVPRRLHAIAAQLMLHEADVADGRGLDAAFDRARPEFVFHLATPRGNTPAARDEMLRANVLGAAHLLRLVREHRVRRLVVAGSCLEYAPSASALTENSPVAPQTWHGATKAAAHLIYRQAALAEGAPVVLLRLFHIYGPWESAHRLAPTAIRAALAATAIPLTEPGIRHDWIFVDDVVEALLLAARLGRPGDVFNIGSGVEVANEALVRCVEAVTNRPVRVSPERAARRVTDTAHRFADPSLASRLLGWRSRHDLDAGLGRMVEWYRAHPHAWSADDDVRPEAV